MRFASVESDMHLLCRGFRVQCAVLLALVLSLTVALAQTRHASSAVMVTVPISICTLPRAWKVFGPSF
jgi:predicted benzoate:H+ symporter BenE